MSASPGQARGGVRRRIGAGACPDSLSRTPHRTAAPTACAVRCGQAKHGMPASCSRLVWASAERGATQQTYTGTVLPSARSRATASRTAAATSADAERCSSTGTTTSTSPDRARSSIAAGYTAANRLHAGVMSTGLTALA